MHKEFFLEKNIKSPSVELAFYDNVLNGPKKSNQVESVLLLFTGETSYKINWHKKNLFYAAYIIYAELSGDLEKIDYFKFNAVEYQTWSPSLLSELFHSEATEGVFYGSADAVAGASLWVRYVVDSSGKNLFIECSRDLK